MNCEYCNTQLNRSEKTCGSCGASNPTYADQPPVQDNQVVPNQPMGNQPPPIQPIVIQKSRTVAGLLQIFLPFGIGRFYLGHTGIGVAQLILGIFTCGLTTIWSFIDGIIILCGGVKVDGNGVPLKQ